MEANDQIGLYVVHELLRRNYGEIFVGLS
jgi:hypothetical protein